MTDPSKVIKDQQQQQPSVDVKFFVDSIFDQYRNADITLAKKLGELNLNNHQRLVESSGEPKKEEPAKTHRRVSGFNSVATFDESNEQVHVPIPFHHGDNWGLRNLSKGSRQSERNTFAPPAPWQVQLEAPFKCDLCKKIVTLRSHEAWMIHVYADLNAYVCIHPSCEESFEYFHLWAEHVLTHHFPKVKRYCIFCNADIISTPGTSTRNAFVEHLVYNHWDSLSDAERTAATMNTERFVLAPFNSFPCGFCRRMHWKTWYDFAAHIARHLEEISLAVFFDVSAMNEKPVTTRSRQPKRNWQSNSRERTSSVGPVPKINQPESDEERIESDISGQEDHDNVEIEHEPVVAPSSPVKKPHRDGLRPRKVRDKSFGRFKEVKKEQTEQPERKEVHLATHRVKFKDRERNRTLQRNPSNEDLVSNIRNQPFQQYPPAEVPNSGHVFDQSNSYQLPYQFFYERPRPGGGGYETYRLPATLPSPNYYRENYPYFRGLYNNWYLYQGRVHENAGFKCGCAECASKREEFG